MVYIHSSAICILDYIKFKNAQEGHSPTLLEIANVCHLKSHQAVQHHVKNLIKAGLLIKAEQPQRNLTPK